MDSNRGPSAYQPNPLPLGQTSSLRSELLSWGASFYSLLARGVNGSFVFPVRLLQFLVLAEPLGNFIVGGAQGVRRRRRVWGQPEERNDTLEVSHVYCY